MNLPASKRMTAEQSIERTGDYMEGGKRFRVVATVRHDDTCGNGHNTFCITGEVWRTRKVANGDILTVGREPESCGRCDEDIARAIPELAPFQRWNLVSTDGPMHYPGNVLYHAGDRDCWGTRKGEVRQTELRLQFGDNPILHKPGRGAFSGNAFLKWLQECGPRCGYDFEILRYDRDNEKDRATFGPKFTLGGFAEKWHECPFDDEDEAERFLAALQHCEPKFVEVPTVWGEGKEPDLEAARSCAVWPDATLEQLNDREALEARLPGLMAEFKRDVEALGLIY